MQYFEYLYGFNEIQENFNVKTGFLLEKYQICVTKLENLGIEI